MTLVKKIYFLLSIAIIFISGTGCENIVDPMQNFVPNQYPSIVSITCDPDDSTSLTPNTPVTITVEGSDPEGEPLHFSYDSEDGSFSGQTEDYFTSTVTFYTASYLVTSQSVRVTVKVTDAKGFSVYRQINVGQTKSGPTVTFTGDTPKFITSDSQAEFTFSANESGVYQVQVYDAAGLNISYDSSETTYHYKAEENITVKVDGPAWAGTAGNAVLTSNPPDTVGIILMDNLGASSAVGFNLYLDDDAPVSSATSDATSSLNPISVKITANDYNNTYGYEGSGVTAISYILSNSALSPDPDFSGTGTVVERDLTEITVGEAGMGTYYLKYRAMDRLGNIESVKTVQYEIKEDVTPTSPVTNLIATQISNSAISLSWTNPSSSSDSDFDHVLIEAGDGSITISETTADSSYTTCTVSSLSPDTEYTVTAYAVDDSNNNSTGESFTIITPPSSMSSIMDVYYIKNLSDLETLQTTDTLWNNYCILTNDIIIAASSSTSIGTDTKPFTGYFLGNGHSITGLTISESTSYYTGFFGYLDDAVVRDFNLVNPDILGYAYVAAIAGFNDGTITGCTVSITSTGKSVSGDSSIGGISGFNRGTISDCRAVDITVIGSIYAGGIAGQNNAQISGSVSSGTVGYSLLSSERLGGLVGVNFTTAEITNSSSSCEVICSGTIMGGLAGENVGTISGSYATGNVNGPLGASRAGGLIGYNTGNITSCSAGGAVSAYNYSGGLIGYNTGNITSCSADGTVNNNGSEYAGGLIAYNEGHISDCYSTGTVNGCEKGTGGFIGYNKGIITSCHTSISGYTTSEQGYDLAVRGVHGYTGGFVGNNAGGTVTYCFAAIKNHVGSLTSVGGFAGHNTGTINCSYVTGKVFGWNSSYYGGFVAYNDTRGSISNCYARVDVSGNDTTCSGGFAGNNVENITYCYETGTVAGTYDAYGFTGSNSGTINYSYFNSANTDNGSGTAVSLSSMLLQSTYLSWDFTGDSNGNNDYWSIGILNDGYPYLTDNAPSE